MKKIFLIIFLGLLLRLINLNQSFWLDEAAQVIESLRPFREQFNLAVDFHPPLFHLMLHFWLKLGIGEVVVRMLPVSLGIGSIFLLYKIGQNLFNERTALAASLFLAVSPYHIWYSQEVRPYMLFVFLSLLATFFLIKKKWSGYIPATILLLYTNYFSVFVLIGQAVFYLYNRKNKIKPFILSITLSFLLFLPWLPSMWRQITVAGGTAFAGWKSVVSVDPLKLLPLTLAKFLIGKANFNNNWIYLGLLLPGMTASVASVIAYLRKKMRNDVLLFLIIPLMTAFLVSIFFPIVAPQRLIFLLPVFYLLVAAGAEKSENLASKLITAVILLTSVTGTLFYYFNPEFQRENWKQAVAEVERESDQETLVLFAFPEPFAPYQFYAEKPYQGKGIAPKFSFNADEESNLTLLLNSRINEGKIYYFAYLSSLTDPEKLIPRSIEGNGYVLDRINNYPGVGFVTVYERTAD